MDDNYLLGVTPCMDVLFRWVDEKRGVCTNPFDNRKNEVILMVYQTGPSIFTKRTLWVGLV